MSHEKPTPNVNNVLSDLDKIADLLKHMIEQLTLFKEKNPGLDLSTYQYYGARGHLAKASGELYLAVHAIAAPLGAKDAVERHERR